jgi:hypothetical protein
MFENKHEDNSYASGTPVTDGNQVYVSFLDGEEVVAAAYDFGGFLCSCPEPDRWQDNLENTSSESLSQF